MMAAQVCEIHGEMVINKWMNILRSKQTVLIQKKKANRSCKK